MIGTIDPQNPFGPQKPPSLEQQRRDIMQLITALLSDYRLNYKESGSPIGHEVEKVIEEIRSDLTQKLLRYLPKKLGK